MTITCDRCQKQFDSERGYNIHLSMSHGDRARETVECPICGESFTVATYHDQRFCSPECVNEWRSSGE